MNDNVVLTRDKVPISSVVELGSKDYITVNFFK